MTLKSCKIQISVSVNNLVDTGTLIHLCMICGYFCAIMADLTSYNRDHTGHKSEIFTTCPFICKVYQFLTLIKLYDWFFLALMLLNGSLLSFIKQANNISLFSWPTIWYWFKCGTIEHNQMFWNHFLA